jgi:hypothetical protein
MVKDTSMTRTPRLERGAAVDLSGRGNGTVEYTPIRARSSGSELPLRIYDPSFARSSSLPRRAILSSLMSCTSAAANNAEVQTVEDIEFLIEATSDPYGWVGDGTGEKGYNWIELDDRRPMKPEPMARSEAEHNAARA